MSPVPPAARAAGTARRPGPAGPRVGLPRLHVVTDDRVLSDPEFGRRAEAVLDAGGPDVALHLRGRSTSARRLFLLVDRIRPRARTTGGLLLVNDRVDLALTAGVHGVHLGSRSLPPAVARGLLGGDPWIGLSVHDDEAAAEAEGTGADYLVVGTIFATASHPDRPGSGPELLSRVRGRIDLPLLAIGGVSPDRIRAVTDAGAHGAAVLSGVWDDPAPGGAVARYLEALSGEPVGSAEPEGGDPT